MAKFTCNFISYILGRTVDITVVIPSMTAPETMRETKPKHHQEALYPVCYLLHGVGNNHTAWTAYTNVELFAEEQQMAVVNISAENKSYINYGVDADGLHGGDRFYDFLSEELPDFIGQMFPISSKPEDTYIAGLSMGGYGTLVHAFSHPERFRAFGTFSASVSHELTVNNPAIPQPEYQPGLLLDKLLAEGKKIPACYVACGGDDFLIEQNEVLRKRLQDVGADITWERIEGYGHEWRFWNIVVEKFFNFLQTVRTDAYAGKKRRS